MPQNIDSGVLSLERYSWVPQVRYVFFPLRSPSASYPVAQVRNLRGIFDFFSFCIQIEFTGVIG